MVLSSVPLLEIIQTQRLRICLVSCATKCVQESGNQPRPRSSIRKENYSKAHSLRPCYKKSKPFHYHRSYSARFIVICFLHVMVLSTSEPPALEVCLLEEQANWTE